MRKLVKTASVAGVLIVALVTGSASLLATGTDKSVAEGEAVTTQLGPDASAISYWVSGSDGWHVVTTVDTVIDSDAERHAIVRFSATLLPGQAQLVSVPFALGEQQQVLRIRRVEDQIEVARVADSSI
jgi:hypothetical protein